MRIRTLVFCGLCATISPVDAAVYHCAGADGPVFQDRPCANGRRVEVEELHAPPAPGLRASERRWLRERARQRPSKPRTVLVRVPDDRAQERRCWKKRSLLEKVSAHLRRGYKPAQGERLRRQRRDYEDYLARFCD